MNIIDRTQQTASIEQNRRGFPIISRYGARRPLAAINAVMLHQMGFDRGNDPAAYDSVIAHFIVLRDGTIVQLRSEETLLNDAHARASIHIEFASFGASGLATAEDIQRLGRAAIAPTWRELEAGRQLVRHLWARHRIRFIYAHRQFNLGGRPNCPGPHIWNNVGEWACYSLGLTSEGAPHPIPDSWRDSSAMVGLD